MTAGGVGWDGVGVGGRKEGAGERVGGGQGRERSLGGARKGSAGLLKAISRL